MDRPARHRLELAFGAPEASRGLGGGQRRLGEPEQLRPLGAEGAHSGHGPQGARGDGVHLLRGGGRGRLQRLRPQPVERRRRGRRPDDEGQDGAQPPGEPGQDRDGSRGFEHGARAPIPGCGSERDGAQGVQVVGGRPREGQGRARVEERDLFRQQAPEELDPRGGEDCFRGVDGRGDIDSGHQGFRCVREGEHGERG